MPRRIGNLQTWRGAVIAILLSVAAGGALGATGRYLVGHWATISFGTGFPWGTLIVNVVGSVLIAILAFAMIERGDSGPLMRAFAITGVLGGFTTFSAFSLDALSLLERCVQRRLYVGRIGVGGDRDQPVTSAAPFEDRLRRLRGR